MEWGWGVDPGAGSEKLKGKRAGMLGRYGWMDEDWGVWDVDRSLEMGGMGELTGKWMGKGGILWSGAGRGLGWKGEMIKVFWGR